MKVSFARGQWESAKFMQAYTFRYQETPAFVQGGDCIGSGVNPAHPEGYDNISLLTTEKYAPGVRAHIRCAFEGLGCPEIIIVPEAEACPDGATRYGACFEVVLYEKGFNVWRHFREDGRCFWHKRLGVQYPVAENVIHDLTVEVKADMLVIAVDGQKTELRTEDVPPAFHLGITVCEGIARVYDMKIESI